MLAISRILENIEDLEDLELDPLLVREMQDAGFQSRPLSCHVPTFKRYQTNEIAACGKNLWPAVSITGPDCALQCDHCKAEILKPMIPARTPEALWEVVQRLADQGARGILLTGGSNHANQVPYEPYLVVLRKIKEQLSDFKLALHTALVSADMAVSLDQAGVDVAMLDIIGSQETITQVYHLKRSVEDFAVSLAHLSSTNMRVVPHIVVGLHYGRLLGEWRALDIVSRHRVDALVLVVVSPIYATPKRPFAIPDVHQAGRFFLQARQALGKIPVHLGCARPPGTARRQLDAYAVLSGLDAIAHPSEGILALARAMGRPVRVDYSCCSFGLEGGVADLAGLEGNLACASNAGERSVSVVMGRSQ